MNREILFRGKRKDNGEWVLGYLVRGKDYLYETEMTTIFPTDTIFYPYTETSGYDRVIADTVGQFTGLCDKNGNKIFEGDILLEEEKEYSLEEYGEKVVGTHNIVAYWNEKACGFWVRRTDKPKGKIYVPEEPLCESFAEELKVVGNIYDNPELLEEKL